MGRYPWYVSHCGAKVLEVKADPGIEAEGQMKHEDRLELQQGKADRQKAEAKAKDAAETKAKA